MHLQKNLKGFIRTLEKKTLDTWEVATPVCMQDLHTS